VGVGWSLWLWATGFKISATVLVELAVLPQVVGWLVDLATVPAFNTTVQNRLRELANMLVNTLPVARLDVATLTQAQLTGQGQGVEALAGFEGLPWLDGATALVELLVHWFVGTLFVLGAAVLATEARELLHPEILPHLLPPAAGQGKEEAWPERQTSSSTASSRSTARGSTASSPKGVGSSKGATAGAAARERQQQGRRGQRW